MRLDKYLAETGNGTRSEVKKLILKGLVSVNDETVKDPGAHIDETSADVLVDGVPAIIDADGGAGRYEKYEYYLLNKPQGVISASKADLRDPDTLCVVDLIEERVHDDLFPVGRLDKDTEGLLLITNDGELAHELLSPKKHVDKTYYVELDSKLDDADIEVIEQGIDIGDEKPTLPSKIENIDGTHCRITIREGRFHQVKRMFAARGHEVVYLKRLSMGSLVLGDIPCGDYIKIDKRDILL